MGGFNSPHSKDSKERELPVTSADQVDETEAPQFVYADDGSLMPNEIADKYYGTLGRPLEQREIRPRKPLERDKPFSAYEAVIMAATTADMVAREVELKIKTTTNEEPAGELINPSVERRGIKVMQKLSESLGHNATPEQLLAACTKYVQDLENMFEDGRFDSLQQKYFEGELLAARSAKRRLDDVSYAISLSSGSNNVRLIDQHNNNLKRAALASAELEIVRAQSKIPIQTPSLDKTSPEAVAPLRDHPMTDTEVNEQRKVVEKLFAERKKESLTTVPDDDVERIKFAKDFFGETQGPQASVLPVSDENVAVFREYFLKELQKNGRMAKTARGRISSNLAGILGSQLGQPIPPGGPKRFAYEIVRSNTIGKNISPEIFNKMGARQFAEEYLGIDVNKVIPDYDSMFV